MPDPPAPHKHGMTGPEEPGTGFDCADMGGAALLNQAAAGGGGHWHEKGHRPAPLKEDLRAGLPEFLLHYCLIVVKG